MPICFGFTLTNHNCQGFVSSWAADASLAHYITDVTGAQNRTWDFDLAKETPKCEDYLHKGGVAKSVSDSVQ